MLQIEIEIPRPYATLFTIVAITAAVVGWNVYTTSAETPSQLIAAGGHVPIETVLEAEQEARKAHIQREVLSRREEIIRFQLRQIQEQRRLMVREMNPDLEDDYRRSIAMLTELLQNQHEAEKRITASLHQIWEEEGHGDIIAPKAVDKPIRIAWPIDPAYGVSATFMDEEYQTQFGIPHRAIDIPALLKTPVLAAADGVVEEVTDNGMGYNWVTIRHEGFATLYGHVLESLVEVGQAVWEGDPIALSGGLPGTPGAGFLTTGPHVHLEVIREDGRIDPLHYLPVIAGLEIKGEVVRR